MSGLLKNAYGGFLVAALVSVATVRAHALPIEQLRAARPIQYVVISFDGAKSLIKWRDTLQFARTNDIKFTYFLSCSYFLHRGNRRLYTPPARRRGRSNIGFAASAEEIGTRLEQVNRALREGHEIASHACGHFSGRRWTRANWRKEFANFRSILKNAYKNNGLAGEPADWRDKVDRAVVGFRAPYLDANRTLDGVLSDAGFRYDASRVGRRAEKPVRNHRGLWSFRLAMIPEGRRKRSLISMDYNFYVRHSKAKSDPARRKVYRRRMFDAYMSYFEHNYRNGRQPVHIGHHFSYWNGGAYWSALKAFASRVCGRSDVRCVSYAQLANALDSKLAPVPTPGVSGATRNRSALLR